MGRTRNPVDPPSRIVSGVAGNSSSTSPSSNPTASNLQLLNARNEQIGMEEVFEKLSPPADLNVDPNQVYKYVKFDLNHILNPMDLDPKHLPEHRGATAASDYAKQLGALAQTFSGPDKRLSFIFRNQWVGAASPNILKNLSADVALKRINSPQDLEKALTSDPSRLIDIKLEYYPIDPYEPELGLGALALGLLLTPLPTQLEERLRFIAGGLRLTGLKNVKVTADGATIGRVELEPLNDLIIEYLKSPTLTSSQAEDKLLNLIGKKRSDLPAPQFFFP
jgi:hypothetical protein